MRLRRQRELLITLLIAIATSGCDKQIQGYVSEAPAPEDMSVPRRPAAVETPPGQFLRASSGSVDATASPLRMRAGVNGQARQFQMGADRRAVLSVGKARVTQTP